MSSKYARFDSKLFAWLRRHRADNTDVTTAAAITALAVTDKAKQRHISRRFTQLEDREVLDCRLAGTTRICKVVAEVPDSLGKKHWRSLINAEIRSRASQTARKEADAARVTPAPSIRARNSEEFLAAGGQIQTLPNHWDNTPKGSKPLGDSFTFDD